MATIFNKSSAEGIIPVSDRYPVGVPRRLSYPDIPAWGLLARAARLMPGRLACWYNDIEWTWEELNLDAIRTADALCRLGLKQGDRVGILLPNIPEYVIALNGIWRAGGIAVALSPLSVPEECDRVLEATACKMVVCLDMLAGLISGTHRPNKTLFVSLRPRLPLFEQLGYLFLRRRRTGHWWMSANEHVGWFWDELAGGKSFQTGSEPSAQVVPQILKKRSIGPLPESDFDDYHTISTDEDIAAPVRLPGPNWSQRPAYILPTGGTTGEPKAVTLSHANLVANAWQQYYWAGAAIGRETLLSVLPFFHSYGLSTNVMGGAAMVGSLIMDHRFSPRRVVRLIERHRPTVFHAVPAMLAALNEHLNDHSADLSSLKWVISGGAPLAEDVGQTFAKYCGAIVVEGYGLSEASPVTHVGPLDGSGRFGTVELPLPDTECRIVDSLTGHANVGPGEVGELLVRGPQVMLGYWDECQNGATTKLASNDGWLHTGDLVKVDSDGLYRIVERKKDLIITSGFNVYPQEVEAVLKQHESVRDAAVVGMPDDSRGEIVTAFVTLDDSKVWDEAELVRHCRRHLAAHKRPREFHYCKGDLPRSFLGKVIRRKLREETQEAES